MIDQDLDYLLFVFESTDPNVADEILEDLSNHEEMYALYLETDSEESEQFSEDNIIGYARLDQIDMNSVMANPWNEHSYLEFITIHETEKRCILKQTIVNS